MEAMWKITLEEEHKKNPELRGEDIDEVQSWMKKQAHLPSITNLDVVMFLQACQWDLTQTKETIESYYTYRTSLVDFFSSRDPISKEIQEIAKVINVTILPKSDPEGNRILWGSLVDPDPNHYNFATAVKYFTMTSEVFQLEHGTVPGFIVVYDVKNLSFSHLLKTPLTQVSKYTHYAQEAASFPVKGIHYLNTNAVLDKLVAFTKPFLRSNILDVLQLHSNLETFFKSVPREIVPKDYGGDEPTLKEMNDVNLRKIEDYREFFQEEQKIRVDESKRVGKKGKSSASTVNGLDSAKGSFKKLSID
ncbi:hypothetical protein J6590_053544 [Homalodisca vitripennis]|nr:hypothetical protein J6590_053544 [Homalodisca vitripennis]